MPSQKNKDKALETLDTMRTIIRRGRLTHEDYATEVIDEELYENRAICQGRKYCLLGTAWVSYGVTPTYKSFGSLPGVTQGTRASYLRNRPALRMVYDALNKAAEVRIKRLGLEWPLDEDNWTELTESAAEAYFENVLGDYDDEKRERRAAYSLLDSARKIIEAR